MTKLTKIIVSILLLLIITSLYILDYYHLIPRKSYRNEDFNIETYHSSVDYDNDNVDDQNDILLSAREYVKTKPKYKSKYYKNGYPDDGYGVCTDVIAFAFKGAGYDLLKLVNEDVIRNRDLYEIELIDKNIDFRRVQNLKVFFDNNAISLTTDINEIKEWQGGDIVVFTKHIAIVSDKRNKRGIPYIIHNAGQIKYEEDSITRYQIIGHYRYN